MPETRIIETDIPARLDRLPWTRFHTLVVVALGITWVLDGLEVTVAGSIAGALQESPVLHFTAAEVGLVSSAYLTGAIIGAVLFGYLTDRFGRKRLFMVTLGIYLTATAATASSCPVRCRPSISLPYRGMLSTVTLPGRYALPAQALMSVLARTPLSRICSNATTAQRFGVSRTTHQ